MLKRKKKKYTVLKITLLTIDCILEDGEVLAF